jgi:hypothetical protein
MSWSDPINLYCERTDASLWAEPINALTNVAFLVAAALALALWRRHAVGDRATLALIAITALIGFGSFAFHTLATRGAVLLDVIPIALFVYGYLYLALRRFLHVPLAAARGIVVVFVLLSRALSWVLPADWLNGSHEYFPPLAALVVVGFLARRDRAGRAVLLAAGLFLISLTFRTLDKAVCAGIPIGTHFIWHMLNAAVLYILLRTAVLGVKGANTPRA